MSIKGFIIIIINYYYYTRYVMALCYCMGYVIRYVTRDIFFDVTLLLVFYASRELSGKMSTLRGFAELLI